MQASIAHQVHSRLSSPCAELLYAAITMSSHQHKPCILAGPADNLGVAHHLGALRPGGARQHVGYPRYTTSIEMTVCPEEQRQATSCATCCGITTTPLPFCLLLSVFQVPNDPTLHGLFLLVLLHLLNFFSLLLVSSVPGRRQV